MNGEWLTNGKILQHDLYHPGTSDSIMATITYRLQEHKGGNMISIQEVFTTAITKDERTASEEGWGAALHMIKDLLER